MTGEGTLAPGGWWLQIVARVLHMIYPGTDLVPGLEPRRSLPFLRVLCDESPATLRLALHASVLAFLLTPPFTVRSLRPAHRLLPDEAARHTAACAGHRVYLLRQAVLMLKTAGGLCWGSDPEVRSNLGVAPYPEERWHTTGGIPSGGDRAP